MSNITSLKDHEDETGKVDWASYNKAQVANGETCYVCGGHIMHVFRDPPGRMEQCGDCKRLSTGTAAETHERHVRCPWCKGTMSVHDCELFELYEEGGHDVFCTDCDKEFRVETRVSFTFTSPALGKKSYDEEEDD